LSERTAQIISLFPATEAITLQLKKRRGTIEHLKENLFFVLFVGRPFTYFSYRIDKEYAVAFTCT
jgi:hypothetical protein